MKTSLLVGALCTINITATVFCVIFNFPEVAEISYYISTFILCLFSFANNPNDYELRFLKRLLFFFFLPIAFHFYVYRDQSVVYFFHYIASVIAGVTVARYFTEIPFRLIFITIVFIEVCAILFISESGNMAHLNRTYYTVPLVILLFCMVISDYYRGVNNSYFSVTLLFIVSILSNSRSVSTIVFLLMSAFPIRYILGGRYSIKALIFLPIALISIAVTLYFMAGIINDLSLLKRFSERGLDSGRFVFWAYYLTELDYKSIFLGVNVNQLWVTLDDLFFNDGGRHTLHNSFLSLHSHGGIIPVIFLVFTFLKLVDKNFSNNRGILVIGAFFILIAKANFDVIIFPQRFDFLMFAVIFFLWSNKKHAASLKAE